MGYIYKITNTVNNKVYIGQTVKTVQKRFTQHKNNSNKPYFAQIVLYKAFNKYGIENFSCETIEEVPNNQLNDREKYWIEYYNSYFEGYNSTLGGKATQLYNWDIEDIIDRYHILKSARAVAREIGCDHNTIDNILNSNGIKRYTAAQQISRPVIIEKDNNKYRFETTTDAAQWFINNKITKVQQNKQVRQELNRRIKENTTYFNYKIYYESKI